VDALSDGFVTLRPPAAGDAATLVAGRDADFHRWLGRGADTPTPTAVIVAGGEVVGWIDHDTDRTWLEPGEVNVGYNVFAPHRGRGYATRAVGLLLRHLAEATPYDTATLLIHPENHRSLAVAARAGFVPHGDIDGSRYFKRRVRDRPGPGL
jgi:RimJ/RimL family protein N-acetyltransferase